VRKPGAVALTNREVQGPSFLAVVWIVVGVVVAAIYDYFDSLGTVGRVFTVIAAVLLWPLLLFGFDIRISR
jgi:ATP/ADP translocase